MVGKSDWAATHCIDLRAKGIGFVPAMEGMGVISKAVAAEPSRESHTQDRETLLLGHPRLGRLVSNGNNQHEDNSNAQETQTTRRHFAADSITNNGCRCLYVLRGSTAILDRMLATCKATQLPELHRAIEHIDDHISAYEALLLNMPPTMNMIGGSVRPHLIWKHMLAAVAKANLSLNSLRAAQLQSIATQFEMPDVPSFLTPQKLAGQVSCDVPLLLPMWLCLWKDAMELEGAFDAVFQETDAIKQFAIAYMNEHEGGLIPHALMHKYLSSRRPSPDAQVSVDAKRGCPPTTGVEGPGDQRIQGTRCSRPRVCPTATAPPGKVPHQPQAPHAKSAARSQAKSAARPKAKAAARPVRTPAAQAQRIKRNTEMRARRARAKAAAAKTTASAARRRIGVQSRRHGSR